jgi:hypothetical protein
VTFLTPRGIAGESGTDAEAAEEELSACPSRLRPALEDAHGEKAARAAAGGRGAVVGREAMEAGSRPCEGMGAGVAGIKSEGFPSSTVVADSAVARVPLGL